MLLEVEKLDVLLSNVTDANYARTCLYLFSCANYLPEPEDAIVLKTAHSIFMKVGKMPDAIRVALKLCEQSIIEETFNACTDMTIKKQLCYMLARHGHPLKLDEGPCEVEGEHLDTLQDIMSHSDLTKNYLTLARDLDVMEPKLPEDIYKSHLEEGRQQQIIDSAKGNLASTYVNAFVNAGFGKDKLMTVGDVWLLNKNKVRWSWNRD